MTLPGQATLPSMPDMAQDTAVQRANPQPSRAKTRAPRAIPGPQLVRLSDLAPPRVPVRTTIDRVQVTNLAASIAEVGMLHAITARPSEEGPPYEVVAGLYRYLAAREAGLEWVPVIVRQATDQQVVLASLHENLIRNALSLAEEAAGFGWLRAGGLSGERIAAHLHVAPSYVSRVLRAARDPSLMAGVVAGAIGKSEALELVDCPPQRREELAQALIERRQLGEPMGRQELRDAIGQARGLAQRKVQPPPSDGRRQARVAGRAIERLLSHLTGKQLDETIVAELRMIHRALSEALVMIDRQIQLSCRVAPGAAAEQPRPARMGSAVARKNQA